ncbi:MAG: hypothetical protein J7639_29220 [Paenibacillaceae bacterium]|nr:hypothetical protein [Paenibacillaceae bacterium]
MSKRSGAFIRSGPADWAIVQQRDGFADLELSGGWELPEPDGCAFRGERVIVRIVREDDGQIVVSWTKSELFGTQQWRLTIRNVPAGGLYRIETGLIVDVEGGPVTRRSIRGDMIRHIGIGDLWVIAGQSNAVGYGQGAIYDPPAFGVHLFRGGMWEVAAHPLSGEGFFTGHSPMLAFAKTVLRETGMPIGLLQTAKGASPLRSWNPGEDGELYAGLLDAVRLAGGRVRGVLWYQGCSDGNATGAPTYLDRFAHVVDSWRRHLNDPHLPVLTVQLNRSTGEAGPDADASWGTVREAQRQAARRLAGVFVVPAIDCPLSDSVHNSPAGNLVIGERLAQSALAHVYRRQGRYRAPDAARAERQAGGETARIALRFDHVVGELAVNDPHGAPFTVFDAHGKADIVSWRISGRDEIELTLARPLTYPGVVNGMFEKNPCGGGAIPVDTGTGMPLLAFYRLPVQE